MALTHKVQPVLHGSVAEAMHNSVPAGLADREVFCLRLQEIYGAAIACEILGAMSSNQYRCYWLNPLQSSRLRGEDLGGEPVVSLAEVFRFLWIILLPNTRRPQTVRSTYRIRPVTLQ